MLMAALGSTWEWPIFGQLPPVLLENTASWHKVRHWKCWRIAPNVGLSLKFVTLPPTPPSHISNSLFSIALKSKANKQANKKPGAITKDLRLILRSKQHMFPNICAFLKLFFSHYCQEKRSLVECFSTEAQVYNTPCWLHIKDTKY